MNYNNILILKENKVILYYNNKDYLFIFNQDILNKGIILNQERFIKTYNNYLKSNKLSTIFWHKELIILYNSFISLNDLQVIKNTFNELNYHKLYFISINKLLSLTKKNAYLFLDKDYYYLYYIDKYNNKKNIVLDLNILTNDEINYLITNKIGNKELIVITDNNKYALSDKINYYYYDNIMQFFLNYCFEKIKEIINK